MELGSKRRTWGERFTDWLIGLVKSGNHKSQRIQRKKVQPIEQEQRKLVFNFLHAGYKIQNGYHNRGGYMACEYYKVLIDHCVSELTHLTKKNRFALKKNDPNFYKDAQSLIDLFENIETNVLDVKSIPVKDLARYFDKDSNPDIMNICMIQNPHHRGKFLPHFANGDMIFTRDPDLEIEWCDPENGRNNNLYTNGKDFKRYLNNKILFGDPNKVVIPGPGEVEKQKKLKGLAYLPRTFARNIPCYVNPDEPITVMDTDNPKSKPEGITRIGIYSRPDVCPKQTEVLFRAIKNIPKSDRYKYQIIILGSSEYQLNEIDAKSFNSVTYTTCEDEFISKIHYYFYSEADKPEPFPNLLFNCIYNRVQPIIVLDAYNKQIVGEHPKSKKGYITDPGLLDVISSFNLEDSIYQLGEFTIPRDTEYNHPVWWGVNVDSLFKRQTDAQFSQQWNEYQFLETLGLLLYSKGIFNYEHHNVYGHLIEKVCKI